MTHSQKIPPTCIFRVIDLNTVSVSLKVASLVDIPFPKTYCSVISMLFVCRYWLNLLYVAFSCTLEKTVNKAYNTPSNLMYNTHICKCMGSHYTISKGSVFCIQGPEDDFTISRNMLPVQYASTIHIGVLDGHYLILLLVLKHSGMVNTKIK